MRRLRRTPALRRLVAEHRVSVDDLVAPLFVKEGIDAPEPVASMPGVVQHTQESLRKEVRALADLGIPAVMLFGIPDRKDAHGSQADAIDGVVQAALRTLRDEVGDSVVLMADDCLDEYTDHGHCGLLTSEGEVDAVTFTSSSTVKNFCDAVGPLATPQPSVITIGPVTSQTARDLGLRVDAEADPHTIDGLVNAVLEVLR
jgi:delta-aminolevulinic acid dehydratase/porphobilinogen synthase